MEISPAPKVLLVGAFERDNFGDLLFHLMTRQALIAAGFVVEAASVLSAHVEATPEFPIMRMHEALSTRTYSAIWVVGGEIGGVRVVDALGMSLPENERRVVAGARDGAREIFARFATGLSLHAPAYLPALDAYPLNRSANFIVHSVGVSNLGRGLAPEALDSSLGILSSAAEVTVRDRDSHDFLAEHGVESVLVPDVIHALPTLTGWSANELVADSGTKYVVLQINQEQLALTGLTTTADQIAALSEATRLPIRLFAAGITHGHDSTAAYDAIIARLAQKHPHVMCERVRTRSPRGLVAEIAGAALWIGTSLHGRILAASFGVPRISLTNDKVARYARTWDEPYPSDLSVDDAIRQAAEVMARQGSSDATMQLGAMAADRLRDIIASIGGPTK